MKLVAAFWLLLVRESWSLSATPKGVWSASRWRLSLDIGREPGTQMPADWAVSGARLGLPVEVLVEASDAADPNAERDLVGGSASRVSALTEVSFVGEFGRQTVCVREGGWRMERGGRAAERVQFWLDFGESDSGEAARRRDVSLPAERLFFSAAVWCGAALTAADASLAPLRRATRDAQARLEAALDHESGDRRLDGVDALETALAYRDVAELVARRDSALIRQREVENELCLPPDASELALGHWPGASEPVCLGSGRVLVRRKSFFTTDYHVLGTFSATPLPDPPAAVLAPTIAAARGDTSGSDPQ